MAKPQKNLTTRVVDAGNGFYTVAKYDKAGREIKKKVGASSGSRGDYDLVRSVEKLLAK